MSFNENDWRQRSDQSVGRSGVSSSKLTQHVIDEDLVPPPNAAGAVAAGDNMYFSVSGTSATDGDVTSDSNGGAQVSTNGSADDETALVLNTNAVSFQYDLSRRPFMATSLRLDANDVGEYQLFAGFMSDDDGDAVADVANGELDVNGGAQTVVGISFDTDDSDGNFQATYKDGSSGSVTKQDTGVSPSADTDYTVMVDVDEDQKAHFYINGDHVFTSPKLSSSDVLGPVVGVGQLDTGTRDLFVRRIAVAQDHD